MGSAILGLRGTGQFNTDFRPTNYRELYTLLEPNGTAPLNALLAMSKSEQVDDPKFNHFLDELPDRVVTISNAAGYAAGVTSLTIAASGNAGFITKNTVLVNARTNEVMQVTADTTGTTLTVIRNVGGTNLAILDADKLVIAGSANPEGGDVGTPVSFDPTLDYNFTQIFRTPFSVSNTLKNTYTRTGDKEKEYKEKALKLHMQDIERAFIFGRRAEVNGSTSQPTRYTGGLMTMIPNVIDVGAATTPGTMTEKDFDRTLIENLFAYGSKQKVAFCGPRIASNMMEIAKNRWQPTQISQGAYGVSFTQYSTFAGDLLVYLHPQFRQLPGMDSTMLVLDLPQLRYRYLANRDTKLLPNRQGNGADGVTHEYLTECGLEMTQSKVHAIVKGWTKVS